MVRLIYNKPWKKIINNLAQKRIKLNRFAPLFINVMHAIPPPPLMVLEDTEEP